MKSKIKLIAVKRQKGNTKKLVNKLLTNPDSILIVQNALVKKSITGISSDVADRIVFVGSRNYDIHTIKYNTWYLDTCTLVTSLNIITTAIKYEKILIGHYDKKE